MVELSGAAGRLLIGLSGNPVALAALVLALAALLIALRAAAIARRLRHEASGVSTRLARLESLDELRILRDARHPSPPAGEHGQA